jgi:hypothetical protein
VTHIFIINRSVQRWNDRQMQITVLWDLPQNPFEVSLTIVRVKIRHGYKWGYDNLVQVCMGLSQTSASLYWMVITSFIGKPDSNPNNSQINLKWILDVLLFTTYPGIEPRTFGLTDSKTHFFGKIRFYYSIYRCL